MTAARRISAIFAADIAGYSVGMRKAQSRRFEPTS